jgi:hypothetical protein
VVPIKADVYTRRKQDSQPFSRQENSFSFFLQDPTLQEPVFLAVKDLNLELELTRSKDLLVLEFIFWGLGRKKAPFPIAFFQFVYSSTDDATTMENKTSKVITKAVTYLLRYSAVQGFFNIGLNLYSPSFYRETCAMTHPLNNDLSGRVWTYYDLGVSPLRLLLSFNRKNYPLTVATFCSYVASFIAMTREVFYYKTFAPSGGVLFTWGMSALMGICLGYDVIKQLPVVGDDIEPF